MEKIRLSTSLIRKFIINGNELEDICYFRILKENIERKYQSPMSDAAMKGIFFESLAIGGDSAGDSITDLPRKKITKAQEAENRIREESGEPLLLGEKTVDQLRIEQQVMRFKKKCVDMQLTIFPGFNTQVKIKRQWENRTDVLLSGVTDIFPLIVMGTDGSKKLLIVDLKLTKDVENSFVSYKYPMSQLTCWGSPEKMDKLQAYMYHYLIRDIDFELNPSLRERMSDSMLDMIENGDVYFLYWVFDYGSDNLKDKMVKVKWDKLREMEMHETIRKVVYIIDECNANGWHKNPSYNNCKNCPVSKANGGECETQTIIQTV